MSTPPRSQPPDPASGPVGRAPDPDATGPIPVRRWRIDVKAARDQARAAAVPAHERARADRITALRDAGWPHPPRHNEHAATPALPETPTSPRPDEA